MECAGNGKRYAHEYVDCSLLHNTYRIKLMVKPFREQHTVCMSLLFWHQPVDAALPVIEEGGVFYICGTKEILSICTGYLNGVLLQFLYPTEFFKEF